MHRRTLVRAASATMAGIALLTAGFLLGFQLRPASSDGTTCPEVGRFDTRRAIDAAEDCRTEQSVERLLAGSAKRVQVAVRRTDSASLRGPSQRLSAVVTLGDSITDGHGATTNGNDRWPDRLAERLQATPATRGLSVLNQGIGGNKIITPVAGPNALARFDRDVLSIPNVSHVVLLEGINDIGTSGDTRISAEALIEGYRQLVLRAGCRGPDHR